MSATTTCAVLRVRAAFELERFLTQFPALAPDAVWQPGQLAAHPREAGFNLALFEDLAPEQAERELVAAIQRLREALTALPPGAGLIDLGVFAPAGAMSSVTIGPRALATLAEAGLGLSITTYPCADED